MDVELRSKFNLLNENYKENNRKLYFSSRFTKRVMSLIEVTNEEEIDLDKIKKIRKYLNRNNLSVSNEIKWITSSLFSLYENYEDIIMRALKINLSIQLLFQNNSEEVWLASSFIATKYEGELLEEKINRIQKLMGLFEDKNIYLDIVTLSFLAALNIDEEDVVERLEIALCYLKEAGLQEDEMVYALAAILIIDREDIQKRVERALNIRCVLNSELEKIDTSILPLVGIASLVVNDGENFSKEFGEGVEYIANFERIELFKSERLSLLLVFGLLLNRSFKEIKNDLIEVCIGDEENNLIIVEDLSIFLLIKLGIKY